MALLTSLVYAIFCFFLISSSTKIGDIPDCTRRMGKEVALAMEERRNLARQVTSAMSNLVYTEYDCILEEFAYYDLTMPGHHKQFLFGTDEFRHEGSNSDSFDALVSEAIGTWRSNFTLMYGSRIIGCNRNITGSNRTVVCLVH